MAVHASNGAPSRHQPSSDAGPHSDLNKSSLHLRAPPAVKFEQSAQSRQTLKCQVPPMRFEYTSGSDAPSNFQSAAVATSPVLDSHAPPTTKRFDSVSSNRPPSTPTSSGSQSTYPTRLVSTPGANKVKWYAVVVGRRTGIFDDW